ncbi:MAG TPA: DUF4136 domain-containing protein [Salegentibacter sp.]|uniref:DUF4136 domain-containing protein n=1 Tax=Salegentibacter sp. TaxID=1903072 RepID=UPI002F93F275
MKKIKLVISLGFVAIMLASCGSGVKLTDEAKTLRDYNSYAFLPNNDTIMSRAYDNERINDVIVSSINANMKEQGYILDKRQPDILIYVHTMFDEKAEVNANPVYSNYSYYRPGLYIGPYVEDYVYQDYYTIQRLAGNTIKQLPYKERSIVIDFINRRNKEIIWRATSEEEIGTRRMDRDLRNYVDDVFKNFP